MVRLKDLEKYYEQQGIRHFNSSMVRLKDMVFADHGQFEKISIPVWCDWRSSMMMKFNREHRFQFQYGAIEGPLLLINSAILLNFNSSMVRLKAKHTIAEPKWISLISIPVWCDWRVPRYEVWFNGYWIFQFQYGAIEGKKFTANKDGNVISIPVWCDWRTILMEHRNIRTLISIPVWCDWRCSCCSRSAWSFGISIPVWCDWRTYPSSQRVAS